MAARWFGVAAAAALIVAAFAGAPVHAQTRQQYEWCMSDDATAEQTIDGCSAAIDSGTYSGTELAVLFYNRGIAYGQREQYNSAMADYNEAIRLDPANASFFHNRGWVYSQKGDYDHAIADYNEAIRLNPAAPRFFYSRAYAYLNKRDYDRAIADYSEAIRLDSQAARYFSARCWARAIAGRELTQAAADCTESLRLRPDDAATLDSRGLTYLRLGRFDEAIADYDAALRLEPNQAESLYGRGLAKRKKGDAAGGDADVAAAQVIQPDIAELFTRYGVR